MPKTLAKKERHHLLASSPMIFGKYKGKTLATIPIDYLRWVLRESEADDATKWLVKRYLQSVGQ